MPRNRSIVGADGRPSTNRRRAWIVTSCLLVVAAALVALQAWRVEPVAAHDARVEPVPGLVLVPLRTAGQGAGDGRVLLRWGATFASASAAGLTCYDRIPMLAPPSRRLECQVRAKKGWAIQIPGSAASARGLLHFTEKGLFSGFLWLDSGAKLAAAREAAARLSAGDSSVKPGPALAGATELYQLNDVGFSITAYASHPGGDETVTYDRLAPSEAVPDPLGPPLSGDAPLPVGGPVSRPQIVPGTKVEPHYTELARKARLQGYVLLELTIDESGNVAEARVVKSLPFGLDQEAVEAARQWKFTPALRDGHPVQVFLDVPVRFALP
jgi:TonB family protein